MKQRYKDTEKEKENKKWEKDVKKKSLYLNCDCDWIMYDENVHNICIVHKQRKKKQILAETRAM